MPAGFNTLAYAETLERGGFTEEQAKAAAHALAEAIEPMFATKQDLWGVEARLKHETLAAEMRLNEKIDKVEMRLNERADKLDCKVDLVETRLDHKIDALEERIMRKLAEELGRCKDQMIRWMVGILVVQSGVIAVLFKFLR